MAIIDYSTTPGSNTSISGINIAEACPAGNLNNAIRQLMADIRSTLTTTIYLGTSQVQSIAADATTLYVRGAVLAFQNAAATTTYFTAGPTYINPATDNSMTLGSSSFRFSDVRAVTATFGSITDESGNAYGYKDLPQNAQTSGYTLILSDAGKHISITTGGIGIPANASVAFPIGTAIVVYNNSASSQTITIMTDTLRLAGTGTTGARTLAGYGLATLVKVGTTTWVASGSGVS